MLAHPVSSASGSGPGGASGPSDFAAARLQVHHEVDGLGDHRPHRLGEAAITGDRARGARHRWRCRRRSCCRCWRLRRRRCAAGSATSRLIAGLCGTSRSAARAGSSSPAAVSAIAFSTWSHGSVWPPSNHGMAPEDSWVAAIDSAVWRHCAGVNTPGTPGTSGASNGAPSASRSTAPRSYRSAGSAATRPSG